MRRHGAGLAEALSTLPSRGPAMSVYTVSSSSVPRWPPCSGRGPLASRRPHPIARAAAAAAAGLWPAGQLDGNTLLLNKTSRDLPFFAAPPPIAASQRGQRGRRGSAQGGIMRVCVSASRRAACVTLTRLRTVRTADPQGRDAIGPIATLCQSGIIQISRDSSDHPTLAPIFDYPVWFSVVISSRSFRSQRFYAALRGNSCCPKVHMHL